MTESRSVVRLRDATAEDMPEVAQIYAHYVETTCITFEEVAPGAQEMSGRLQRLRQSGLPWHVALGETGAVIGYAYAAPFRARSAYRYTVENSVYLAADRVGRGVGTLLMRELIRACTALGYRQMMAGIADFPLQVEEPEPVPPQYEIDGALAETREVVETVRQYQQDYWACLRSGA